MYMRKTTLVVGVNKLLKSVLLLLYYFSYTPDQSSQIQDCKELHLLLVSRSGFKSTPTVHLTMTLRGFAS